MPSLLRLIKNERDLVANLRAGRYMPSVVRMVLELRQEVKPQIFMLKPVGEYGHRLVLDL